MKVELTKVDGVSVGWTMKPENEEDINTLKRIRDLCFWGAGDEVVKYDGRKGGDHDLKDPLRQLSWIQKKHSTSVRIRKEQEEYFKNKLKQNK